MLASRKLSLAQARNLFSRVAGGKATFNASDFEAEFKNVMQFNKAAGQAKHRVSSDKPCDEHRPRDRTRDCCWNSTLSAVCFGRPRLNSRGAGKPRPLCL